MNHNVYGVYPRAQNILGCFFPDCALVKALGVHANNSSLSYPMNVYNLVLSLKSDTWARLCV